jgi:hypothetical protein
MALVSTPPLGSRQEVVASHLVTALVLVGSVTSAYFGAAVASPLRNALLSSDVDGVRDQLLLFAVLGFQTPLQAAAAGVVLWVPLASFATFLLGLSWALIDRRASASSLTGLVVLAAGTAAPGAAAIVLVSLSI